ncbi:hypothetical protein [Candidatus Solirubrobacter pratensis]|uniref:hypothetical protein n=1 Tax=Candidatus Solirubrobacter pratensis TaxID=1298857 RepID=UPI000415E14C|nr:hypothetical protein [Candidatus Solirubrobacter pratensis]
MLHSDNPFLTGRPATAVPGAPGTAGAPAVYDVFAPNATNTGAGAAPVTDKPADTVPPPSSVAGATTSAIEDSTGNSGSPASTGWRPTTRSATRPRCRRRRPGHLHVPVRRPRRPLQDQPRQRVRVRRGRHAGAAAPVRRRLPGVLHITTAGAPAGVTALAAAYKQIDAPFGRFGVATLHYDTRAIATDTSGDAAYQGAVDKLAALLARRDALLPQIQAALDAGHGDPALLAQTNQLAADAETLADSTPPMPGDVSGTVPATLSLTLGAPAAFGAFAPGLAHDYTASTTADVVSTAGDATLSASDPGHLTNGSFSLPDPLQVTLTPSSWSAPVSHGAVAIGFTQHIGATDALRTGSYSKTLTFTLSTTAP